MRELPTGTVSLLFSDIEGSTALLSRLGPAYAQALDGQRQVLRHAWAVHGGAEMGTEGDSFYVVFPTAPAAVAAAVQAQRELALFDWPAGEQVRVRMGVHTGCPEVHDGAYVGMDVHRAARIAAAAHGGQVLISEATDKLVDGHLSDGVRTRDLGSHQLKDIPAAERLFQVIVDGLQTDFSAVKTLGAASSLPVPAGALVGRDGELAELSALLGSKARLVTLTGPGGSGKTRLAIAVAQRSVEAVPDGVYFVPLAAVSTEEAMWTSIGEVLNLPSEARLPPSLLAQVAHRSALLVLDNLEQLPAADRVVSRLLGSAPQLTVLTTSRRPLHVAGEYEHPVPPLELPDVANLHDAERAGAVQKFVQHARMVRPNFDLSDANVVAVVQLCRALDGLPLALELAAARIKLLSPAALVTRLDQALELKDVAVDRPIRQRTMRDTIAWSHDLLNPEQQAFFRRLGVFVGGADLDAVIAVTADVAGSADPLDLVAELVDASLVTITEGVDGEPRVGSLETIRAYARERLDAAREGDDAARLHALHYLEMSQQWRLKYMSGGVTESLEARRRLELEHGNVRAALNWALAPTPSWNHPPEAERIQIGLQVCCQLYLFWGTGNYTEGHHWLEQAVARAGDRDSRELAECLSGLLWLALMRGGPQGIDGFATRCVQMWRRIGDEEKLSLALSRVALLKQDEGELQAARLASEEAVTLAQGCSAGRLATALSVQARQESLEHNLVRSVELERTAAHMFLELGDEYNYLESSLNVARTVRMLGDLHAAHEQHTRLVARFLRLAEPDLTIDLLESFGAVLAEQGDHRGGARLLGAAEAARQQHDLPRTPAQAATIEEPFARARTALSPQAWDAELQVGQSMSAEEALTHEEPQVGPPRDGKLEDPPQRHR